MANPKKPQQDLQETAQQIFLAGLGALSRAEEEGSKFFQTLVRRGQEYDGPGAAELDVLSQQVEAAMMGLRDNAARAQLEADATARKATTGVAEQLKRAREGIGSVFEGVEGGVENAMVAALTNLGVPSRSELEGLQRSLQQLAARLDKSATEAGPEVTPPDVQAVPAEDGWFEIRVHGLMVDRLHGKEAANKRVEQLQTQSSSTPEPESREVTIEPTGGGWYEVLVNGRKVDKVQGRRAAEAAVKRHERSG